MIQIIYTSTATPTLDLEDLEGKLDGWRAANAELGVTSLLFYEDETFFQVLEGEEAAVNSLYEKILEHPHHENVLLLFKGLVDRPAFEGWSLGFFNGRKTPVESLPGYEEAFGSGFSALTLQRQGDRARKLLLKFRDEPWKDYVDS